MRLTLPYVAIATILMAAPSWAQANNGFPAGGGMLGAPVYTAPRPAPVIVAPDPAVQGPVARRRSVKRIARDRVR